MTRAFLDGFQAAANLADRLTADEHWAAYSRQLSDSERRRIERGGRAAGEREGRRYLRAFPPETDRASS